MYDPRLGRFLQRDPASPPAGGDNVYAYAGSNPADVIDPLGLEVALEGARVTREGKEAFAFIITTVAKTAEEWRKQQEASTKRQGYRPPVSAYTESIRRPQVTCQAKGKACVITVEKLVYWAEVFVPGAKVTFPGPNTEEDVALLLKHEGFHAQHNVEIAKNYAAALTKERTCTYDEPQTDESCRAKAKEVETFIIQKLKEYQKAAEAEFHSKLGGMGAVKKETEETQNAGDVAARASIKKLNYQDWSCPK